MNLKEQKNAPENNTVVLPVSNDYSYQKMYEQERHKVTELQMQIVQLKSDHKLAEMEHKYSIDKLVQQQATDQKLGDIAEASSLANQLKDFLPMVGEIVPMIQGITGPKLSTDIQNFIVWFEGLNGREKILFGQVMQRLAAGNNFEINAQAFLTQE